MPASVDTAGAALPRKVDGASSRSPRDWQEAFALLDTALDLDPGAHAAWLAALDGEQAHLRDLLAQLLSAHANAATGDFMQAPAVAALAGSSPTELAGVEGRVGPYRLLREIGQGGMASVWLAERADGLLDRRVALKLPHATWAAASLAERMARERNILATLTHPNIARLYDAGIAADGRPFLAMEYVDGKPIDVYAEAHGLSVHERVELIVQVARAVAHAHARLVVHRDLKPSNILVDAEGASHLLDFGIARLIDPQPGDGIAAGQLTVAPGRALTPDYASPEQVRGDPIGTASDIYSLAVVLFELLVGERPYRLQAGLAAAALAQAVEHAVVPRLSSAAADEPTRRACAGDLDAILARALAKESGKRYPSVDAFADDLERHLRGEPVRARPDSAWYRAERWVRRHKLETAVGAAIVIAVPAGAVAEVAVLAAIAAGAGAALWQARLARRQARIAREQAAHATAVKSFLTSFFKLGSLDEDAGAQLGRLSVRQFVERGARKIDAAFEHEPRLKCELLDVVSALFADLADGMQTVAYARKWLRIVEQVGMGEPERARAMQRMAQGEALLGHNVEAAAILTQAVSRLRLRLDSAGPALLAHLLVDLAERHAELGEVARATAGVNEALTLLADVATDSDGSVAAARAAARFQLAELTAKANQLGAAEPLFEGAITAIAQLHGERSAAVGRHRYLFGSALAQGRKPAEAELQLRLALQLFKEAGGVDDLNAAIVELQLGRSLGWEAASRSDGLAMLAHARDVLVAHSDSVSSLYPALAQLYLAEALIDEGQLGSAREPMEAAMALFRDTVDNAEQRTLAQMILARFRSECGEYDDAERILNETRAERERLLGTDHPLTASVINRIGLNRMRRGDHAGAQAAFMAILGSQDQNESVFGSVKQLARQNFAVTQLESGDVVGALPVLKRNFDDYHAGNAKNALSEASFSFNLGRALLLHDEPARALPLLQRNVDILAAYYPRGASLAFSRCWIGLCRLALGEVAEAELQAELARAAFAAEPTAGPHHRRSLELLTERLASRRPDY